MENPVKERSQSTRIRRSIKLHAVFLVTVDLKGGALSPMSCLSRGAAG
jgi:hypothetical protein